MKHHYVPQFLLRAWTDEADGRLVEFRTDLKDLHAKRKAPAATAFEHGLYAATGQLAEGIDRDAVETQVLQRLDDDAAKVRARILESGLKSLSMIERSAWTRFLMAMRSRQPKLVQRVRLLGTEEARRTFAEGPEEYQALKQDGDPETLEAWVADTFPGLIENFGLRVFASLVDNEMIGNKIIRLRWMRIDFREGRHDLLLSDHPVVFTAGIDAPDLVIALPLSPTVAFFAVGSERVAARLRQGKPSELVMRLNESVIGQAAALIYARSEEPRRFIENRLRRLRLGSAGGQSDR